MACVECAEAPAAGHTRCRRHLEEHRCKSRAHRQAAREARYPTPRRARLLGLLAEGIPLADACTEVDFPVLGVHRLAREDARWALALDTALRAGRDPDLEHGTSRAYSRGKCRCPECRRAHYLERTPRPAAEPAPTPRQPAERHGLTTAQLDALERMWREGRAVADIAAALDRNGSTVRYHAKRAGLLDVPRVRLKSGPGGTGPAGDAVLTDMWMSGTPIYQIAERFGVTPMAIHLHADRLGLPRGIKRPRRPRRTKG